jgi:membrane associated rhomboid family serine protease
MVWARFAPVAITRENDPRVGCLAVPLGLIGGFVLAALGSAAVGASAGWATLAGAVGAVIGLLGALAVLRSS